MNRVPNSIGKAAGRGHFAVTNENYLLLNEGQEYGLHIDSSTPVESFCIFFPPGYVEEIGRNLIISDLGYLMSRIVIHPQARWSG
ncbi:hypothetical protein IFU39_19550 [Paenibacillus sp. CFBP 13594]|uniref:hypothetical protein n=1 Tax=Paenibacillus sp. CFBP 13594 TaxID=2774037 RepID=UPI00177D92CC|nr:hypothetical protein [Paenibacillus sp. CFBP 13594]MBD8840013.1 hypothetical protein [Paenibacillus sp. CFBP 13594]